MLHILSHANHPNLSTLITKEDTLLLVHNGVYALLTAELSKWPCTDIYVCEPHLAQRGLTKQVTSNIKPLSELDVYALMLASPSKLIRW